MDSPAPFRKTDVVSLVPVHKVTDKTIDIRKNVLSESGFFLIC